VTATNTSGSATATLSIAVNDLPPIVGYASAGYSFTAGVAGAVPAPTATGGAVTGWQVAPALPAGLSLSTTDGSISGTPTAAVASSQYSITASNSGGNSVVALTLSVSAGALVELGHAAGIQLLRYGTPNALSQDTSGHWVLWNFATAAILASGNTSLVLTSTPVTPLPVDMAGSTLVIQTSTGLETRASSSGAVKAEIAASFDWWKLASDGSYVCAGNKSELTAWSPAGAVLFSNSGDYSKAVVFAAPTAIRVALGAAGQTVIENVSVPGGTSIVTPAYQGAFSGWFTDGNSFLTTAGNTVLVYSSEAAQQNAAALTSVENLTGQGNWFWTFSNATGLFALYAVGSGAQVQATYQFGLTTATPIPSGTTVGVFPIGGATMSVLDLSGSTPVVTQYTAPLPDLGAYSAASSTAFFVGDGNGVLIDGATLATTPRFLDYGAALSIAGGTNAVAIATGSGRILYVDPATNALSGTIDVLSSNLSISSDGSILAAANSSNYADTDRSIRIYSLPDATLLNTFPFSAVSTPTQTNMSLSGSGTILAETLTVNTACDSEALPVMGGAPVWCDDTGLSAEVGLSPDGTLVATSPSQGELPVSSNLYHNGTLVTAIPVMTVGWIDNTRLLVNDFEVSKSNAPVYTGASIYSASGVLMSTLSIPQLNSIQPVSSSTVYSPTTNAIYSLTNGAVTWTTASQAPTGASATVGAVAGAEVVFTSGSRVLAESY
jgi:hypothetical protein